MHLLDVREAEASSFQNKDEFVVRPSLKCMFEMFHHILGVCDRLYSIAIEASVIRL